MLYANLILLKHLQNIEEYMKHLQDVVWGWQSKKIYMHFSYNVSQESELPTNGIEWNWLSFNMFFCDSHHWMHVCVCEMKDEPKHMQQMW